jgi:hypothetical protein
MEQGYSGTREQDTAFVHASPLDLQASHHSSTHFAGEPSNRNRISWDPFIYSAFTLSRLELVGSNGFEPKIGLKFLLFIDFALRFVLFICSKIFSHLFINFDAKSMSGRDFEPIFEFKTI